MPYRCWRQAPTIATGTIASSDVASASDLGLVEEDRERGDEEDPAADPEHAADARRRRIRAAAASSVLHQPTQQLDRDGDAAGREQQRDRALREPLLQRRAGDHPGDGRDADQAALEQVDVPVEPLADGAEARR